MESRYNTTPGENGNVSATAWVNPLNEQHLQQLEASGITRELAGEVGLWSADESETQHLLGRRAPVGGGLVISFLHPLSGIPLKSSDGHDFVRVRLDDPSKAQDRKGKPSKYLARRGAGQFPYIPSRVARTIRKGAPEIVLVEGEKKALSAVAQGFPAIGLTGNYGWKEKDKQALLPLLEEYLPPGRLVVIVWDSDAALNTGFAASTRMLHDALRRRGCTVKVVVLPQSGTEKVGLDDFLVAHGADAFKDLVGRTDTLPSERQVESDELLLSWCEALRGTLTRLPEKETEALLAKSFKKGLLDQVSHHTRMEILKRLQMGCPVKVAEVFRRAVDKHLLARYGPQPANGSALDISPGTWVRLGDTTRAVIVAVEDAFVWVARKRDKGKSWPVPLHFIDALDVVPTPARIADEFLALNYTRKDMLSLRHYRGEFYRWAGNAYSDVPDTDLAAEAMGFLRDWSAPLAVPRFRQAVVENIKSCGVCHVPAHVTLPCCLKPGFPSCTNRLSFQNGNLDVDGLLRGESDERIWTPPTPQLFSTHGRKFDFDQNAKCPRLLSFLKEVLPDESLRALVQEIAGYVLVPNTSMQRFFLFFGPGANGKQVFSEVLAAIVGTKNVCSVPLSRFGERFSLWPLTTHLLNLVAELPAAEGRSLRIAEDKLKAIVSGDYIEVEKKNKDIIKARPTARSIFSCNELPPIVDRSQGVWRRMIIVPFKQTIPIERQDPDLAKKMIGNELPGSFNWALEGLLRLLKRGHFEEPEACRKLKEEHRRACISEEDFLREHVVADGAGEFVYIDDLYSAYRLYVAGNGGHPVAKRKFSQAVQRIFPACRKDRHALPERKRARGYWGLSYTPDGNQVEE